MKPYFSEGEEVILQSISHPECNGNAVVAQTVISGEKFKCVHCGWVKLFNPPGQEIAYQLNVASPRSCCRPWNQAALRKKHQGGDESFDQLMSSLKKEKQV